MSVCAQPLRRISLELTPIEVAARSRRLPGFVFFDSALESGDATAISIVAADPTQIVRGSAWENLRSVLRGREISSIDDGLPRGFAAGYVDYEGEFCFGLYDAALIYRHGDGTWHELGDMRSKLHSPIPAAAERPRFKTTASLKSFCNVVSRAQRYIAAGDIYQVNLAHQFIAPWRGEPFAFYEALRHYSPAPFAAMITLDGRTILSASPESFLKISGRAIRTRPIKGTRPRHAGADADAESAYQLITSPKEIAELIMITDLERSDLGIVCEYGSVRVMELLKLKRFEQVFHLMSTVEGRLRPEVHHLDAFRACFPGGSITGAPKKRAREIIHQLEAAPRGVYTGALGWFGDNGESQFNIAIRTVIIEGDSAHFHVGAGIVADSVAEQEWQETLDKAAGILLAAERIGEFAPGLR